MARISPGSSTSGSWAPGPPPTVAPGASLPLSSSPSQLTVTFSEGVTAPAAAFSLVGPGGAVPLGVTYNPANFTVTLDAGNALPAGTYMLTIQDSVLSAAA